MKRKRAFSKAEQGISIVELLVVVLIVGIMSAFLIVSFRSYKLYNADNQALRMIDLMREAQQRALSQHETMRIEINSTGRLIRLINENAPGTATDDAVIGTINYASVNYADNVFVGITPTNMTSTPTEASPIVPVTFTTSNHPLSLGSQVATLRFMSNGTVRNAGTDAIGTGSVATGATVYVWSKRDSDTSANPTVANVLRAVTVIGTSGSPKLWKCAVVNNQCTTWTR